VPQTLEWHNQLLKRQEEEEEEEEAAGNREVRRDCTKQRSHDDPLSPLSRVCKKWFLLSASQICCYHYLRSNKYDFKPFHSFIRKALLMIWLFHPVNKLHKGEMMVSKVANEIVRSVH